MRIVGGRHRGRPIRVPPGHDVRPTADRAREALFNVLVHADFGGDGTSPIIEARVLDAFAGSGALGLEALSRGAARLTCLELAADACRAIAANAAALDETARVTVRRADATRPPPAPGDPAVAPCDLVLLDPPYGSGLAAPALTALAAAGWIAPGALVVVESGPRDAFEAPSGFALVDQRRYGKAVLQFLVASESGEAA
jgi:16S rRNA (guanine966-N2)-methyltransferase